jgi:hypothetical protein
LSLDPYPNWRSSHAASDAPLFSTLTPKFSTSSTMLVELNLEYWLIWLVQHLAALYSYWNLLTDHRQAILWFFAWQPHQRSVTHAYLTVSRLSNFFSICRLQN